MDFDDSLLFPIIGNAVIHLIPFPPFTIVPPTRAVFEIKGAPCILCAWFWCQVHDLKAVHPACAPFFSICSVYLSFCALDLNSGCTHLLPSAPSGCTHLNLNFEHCEGIRSVGYLASFHQFNANRFQVLWGQFEITKIKRCRASSRPVFQSHQVALHTLHPINNNRQATVLAAEGWMGDSCGECGLA